MTDAHDVAGVYAETVTVPDAPDPQSWIFDNLDMVGRIVAILLAILVFRTLYRVLSVRPWLLVLVVLFGLVGVGLVTIR